MNIAAGILLKSTALLDDSFFADSIILLTEYNEAGAIGFIVNRPFARQLNELEEFRHSPAFPLYDGGPVGRENLYFIHGREDLVPGGQPLGNGIYFSGDFKAAIKGINNKSLGPSDIKILVGYCGWDAGELEAEIAEGSWTVCETEALVNRVMG